MLRSNMPGSACDDGRASLEFLVLGIAGVILVMFLGLNIPSIQGATLAAETATAHATRVFIQESTVDEALSRTSTAALRGIPALSDKDLVRTIHPHLLKRCVSNECIKRESSIRPDG